MKKVLFFLIFFCVFISFSYSQEGWHWAKSYMGSEAVFSTPTSTTNRIYHTELDSQGNTYILGVYGQGASLNDTDLLGLAFGGATTSILVMKLDPDGNIVWKKSIKNDGANSYYPNWMKLVGDTSLVVATVLDLATNELDLWYLDTLIAPGFYGPLPNYPFPFYGGGEGSVSSIGNAFITFDLNGNIINQHFLQIAHLDSLGTWITDMGTYNFTENGVVSPFHIDNSGNIYICSQFRKLFPPQSNCLSESFRLIIDGERTIDFGMNYRHNSKIFKFSPNFNELIWSRDLMVDTTRIGESEQNEEFTPLITGIESDSSGYIYISGHINYDNAGLNLLDGDTNLSRKVYLDSTNRNLTIDIEPGAGNVGFIIKYDTSGNVLWTNQLHGSLQFAGNEGYYLTSVLRSQFHNLAINEDNNSVYVIAEGGTDFGDREFNSYFLLDDTTKLKMKYRLFFVRYNKADGRYLSHGLTYCDSNLAFTSPNIYYGFGTNSFVVRNNQVFALTLYRHNIIGFDTIIHSISQANMGHGVALVRWREDGGLIDVLNFPINSQNQRMVAGGLAMSNNGDVALFGCVDNEINLGPFTVGQGASGNSRAFIAIYSDPTFNQPYEGDVYFYVPDSIPDTLSLISNISDLSSNQLLLYPNPTKDEVNISSKGEMINSYTLHNVSGQQIIKSEKLKTKSEKLDLSNLPKGVYILKVRTEKNVYSRKIIRN